MLVRSIDALHGSCSDGVVHPSFTGNAGLHDGAEGKLGEIGTNWQGDVMGASVDSVDERIRPLMQLVANAFGGKAANRSGFGSVHINDDELTGFAGEGPLHRADDVAALAKHPQGSLMVD